MPPTPGEPVLLSGADLYRLNCRACHRADGSGAPEEVNSIIDPIRATSPVMVQRRMEATGRPIGAAFAGQLARGAREDVSKRLENGGEKMPAFGHLSRAENDALLAYLEWLADVPGAQQRQIRVAVSATRAGEHLVKGTCHICHDATGSWPDPEALLDGAIPSLAGVARQRTLHDVLTKVRYGKPVVMGAALISYRGRMPVFEYLTDGEISAAYAYLVSYPPESFPRRTVGSSVRGSHALATR
jgi:mono/diheme cytochrome c family protein